jgi:hypothetical protein
MDILPSRTASTLGCTDYFLTEIRNIVRTKPDVSDLWRCGRHQVKVFGLGLGQAFVIGTSALILNSNQLVPGRTPFKKTGNQSCFERNAKILMNFTDDTK